MPPSTAAGGAGTALVLLAASAVTADPLLLAWADLWSEEAAGPPADGRLDPHGGAWHGRPGVLAARVMIACALDDRVARESAVQAYLREHDVTGPVDLTHGLASCVLLDAHLVTLSGGDERIRHAAAQAAGALAGRIGDAATSVGLAHGTPGHLLAALAWQSVSPQPSAAATAAEHLARISADPRRWCRPGWEATWCNGAAGLTLLFLATASALGEPAYLTDAEAAMRIALAAEPRGFDLCCGTPGRAYALGRLAHATGGTSWHRRAAADRARAAGDLHHLGPHGLVKGRAGGHAVAEGGHDGRFVLSVGAGPGRGGEGAAQVAGGGWGALHRIAFRIPDSKGGVEADGCGDEGCNGPGLTRRSTQGPQALQPAGRHAAAGPSGRPRTRLRPPPSPRGRCSRR